MAIIEDKVTKTAHDKLKPHVRELTDAIKSDMTLDLTDCGDKDDLTATVSKDLYVNRLPDGITEETVTRLAAHNADFMAATTLALAEKSMDAMAEHKNVKTVSLHVPTVGKDHFAAEFGRSATIGKNTVHGTTRISHEVYGASAVGQLRVVKDIISDRAREVLAKL